jgi:transcriptional regulator of arginine metabolism
MNSTATRVRRHQQVLDLVRVQPIASQEALAKALEKRGYRVTQSTLSRDLRELRILRVPVPGGFRYLPAGEEGAESGPRTTLSLGRIAAAEVLKLSANEVSVVLHTQAGRAQGVAAYLDGLSVPDLLATVAGDDVVLVIPTSVKSTVRLSGYLSDLFELPGDVGRRVKSGRKSK